MSAGTRRNRVLVVAAVARTLSKTDVPPCHTGLQAARSRLEVVLAGRGGDGVDGAMRARRSRGGRRGRIRTWPERWVDRRPVDEKSGGERVGLASEHCDDGGDLGKRGVDVPPSDRWWGVAREGLGGGVAGQSGDVGDGGVPEYMGGHRGPDVPEECGPGSGKEGVVAGGRSPASRSRW